MNTDSTLSAVRRLAEELLLADGVDRFQLYAAIRVLLDDLDRVNDELYDGNGYTSEKIEQIRWYSRALAGLDTVPYHTPDRLVPAVGTAINSLRSEACFDVQGGRR